MEEKTPNVSQTDTALPSSENKREKQKNPFKIATIICAILALAGIGFGVYEFLQVSSAKKQISDLKVEIKKDDGTTTTVEADKIEVKETDKTIIIADSDESIVTTALDKEQSTPWPEDMSRMENEPETLVNRVKIPKINLDTPAATSINQKIMDKYAGYVDGEQTYPKGPYSLTVTYDSAIRNKILFIILKEILVSYRASGGAIYDVYYYDTSTDQELTVADATSKLGITRSDVDTILPSVADSFDIYYRDQKYCYAPGCTIIENTY